MKIFLLSNCLVDGNVSCLYFAVDVGCMGAEVRETVEGNLKDDGIIYRKYDVTLDRDFDFFFRLRCEKRNRDCYSGSSRQWSLDSL